MEFDHLTVSLLLLRPDAPQLNAEEAAALQDAHLSHIADLHESGHLVAAGPLSDEKFRGLSLLRADVEEARRLKESDPAVQAGRFSVRVMTWTVPAGALSFAPARFPRSVAEAMSQSVAE
jgi:uncharacterized protein YciI